MNLVLIVSVYLRAIYKLNTDEHRLKRVSHINIKNKTMETKQNKTIKIFIIIAFTMLILSVVAVFALKQGNSKKEITHGFVNCGILADSCKDRSCDYLFLCNETEFSDCKVYDCGDEYGMRILGKDGNIQEKTRQKPDQAKVQEIISKCDGSIEVLEKKECEENKAKAKVKVTTAGGCKIGGFTMTVDGANRIANFEKEGGIYNLSVNNCGSISNIKAVGEGGVEIK